MKRYRHEWKYCCSEKELFLLQSRLAAVMQRDEHAGENGNYEIHSLYFDDYRDTCALENDAGLSKRFKYRIRYYGDDVENIFLERKEKYNGLCSKASCRLTKEQYDKIVVGDVSDILWETKSPLLRRFCVDIMNRNFAPKIIVDYERIAFVEPILNVRITLDMNISVSNEVSQFLDGRQYQKYPILEKEHHILEVKHDDLLPGYIKKLIFMDQLQQTSFSKYYFGRQKIQKLWRI